jgi:hypothetical protein
LGSVFTRLLAPVRLLPLRRLRMNDYFIYSESALRSSACIDCVRLLRLRSLTMGDNGNSGDAVTQTSTGYFLKQMFMFISCIIMNIVMFNCGLNIHTCTWIVSLTIILKCLLNYGIKICKNIAYHLTPNANYSSALPTLASHTCRHHEIPLSPAHGCLHDNELLWVLGALSLWNKTTRDENDRNTIYLLFNRRGSDTQMDSSYLNLDSSYLNQSIQYSYLSVSYLYLGTCSWIF